MLLDFVNRIKEQQELEASARKGGLLVVFGRRRVGKTRLLAHWLRARGGMYSQALEGPMDMQLHQVFSDIRPQLSTQIVPKTWTEFLEVLTMQKKPWSLCIDEFPYLTAVEPSLPSMLQKWLDHSLPRGCQLILAGSSTRMMNELFLNENALLRDRAQKLIHLKPWNYAEFCDACSLKPTDMASFEKYSLVGGIPKYCEFVEKGQDVVALAETLYFDFAPYMEQEPQRILRDEGVMGMNAVSVLEAIGRGAERPSEIATRLGTAQTNLSRLLQQLLDASVLEREMPYGESVRTTKKIRYRIADPTMRFWFRVYSPHQSLWRTFDATHKQKLIHDHASTVFEDACRARYDGGARYWEKDIEIDIVAKDPQNAKGLVVAEVKWRKLTAAERRNVMSQLQHKWSRTALSQKYSAVRFEVMDAMDWLKQRNPD